MDSNIEVEHTGCRHIFAKIFARNYRPRDKNQGGAA